ncbi:MAG: hypothetical protein WC666_04565 [Candidatus Paceibacterota bacterium]|jgi:hypothetical protein
MDPKFQTSFIPKKQSFTPGSGIVPQKSSPHIAGIFMNVAIFIFVASLIAIGGAYLWKKSLSSLQESYKKELVEREKQFNLNLVEQLKQVNVQIDTAKDLLKKHIAMSQIFDIIQKMTVADVRFTSMNLTGPTALTGEASLSMNGYGASLSAVAFQSDVLGQFSKYGLGGLQKVIKNPMVSDPVLDSNGAVSFGFSATIESNNLSYIQSVVGSNVEATSTGQ